MYQQFEAPGFLKHLVSFFYVMEHHCDDVPLQTLLPSATEINGWQYSGRWRVKFNMVDGQKEILLPNYYMVGQQTVSYNLTAEQGMAGIFGAALQPGTIVAVTGKPAFLFTNNPIQTDNLFPPEIVEPVLNAFQKATDNQQRLNIVSDFFQKLNIPNSYRLYKEALQIIYQRKGCISVKELCEQLHINERYLQREFRHNIGIAPSTYLKILRFNNVFTELSMAEEKQNIETLAMLFNYYDLSHFNKDHKKYFAIPPSKMMLNRFQLLEELIRNGPYLLQIQSNTDI